MKRIIVLFSIWVLSSAMASCGYHFSGEGSGPRPGLDTIAIPVFENTTSEPELGAIFATELRQQFMQKGPMRVVPVEAADAVIKGRIIDIYSHAVAHRSFERRFQTKLTVESRLYVTVDVRCEDGAKGTVLWRPASLTTRCIGRTRTPERPIPSSISTAADWPWKPSPAKWPSAFMTAC